MAPVAVAFSGGVDSSLLLKVAHDTLGERCVAVTVDAPYQFRQELTDAACLARQLGVRHLRTPFAPATIPGLMNNPTDRCYLCKKAMLELCRLSLASLPLPLAPCPLSLIDGSTLDDQTVHRPGRRALEELGIRSPLAEAGLTKQAVRDLSRQLGLPTWDKPAQSCLLTRFPHDQAVTEADLQRVEWCEKGIQALGFSMVRVRSLENLARLEFEVGELAQARLPDLFDQIETICREAGFKEVMVDLFGYRSGSMN